MKKHRRLQEKTLSIENSIKNDCLDIFSDNPSGFDCSDDSGIAGGEPVSGRSAPDSAWSMVRHFRDKTDWGRILFDTCWCFNSRLAEYLVEYARDYDEGRISRESILAESKELSRRREAMIAEKERLHLAAKEARVKSQEEYRRYAAARVGAEEVDGWRQWYAASESGDLVEQARHEILVEKYLSGINAREALFRRQKEVAEQAELADEEERRYNDSHLFEVRDLGQRARSLERLSERHAVRLGHRMSDDAVCLRSFILSDGQAERLMAICLTILNQYTNGGDFIKFDSPAIRERTVQHIDDYFRNYRHNYDFLTGCYGDDGNGVAVLKGDEELSRHFYNGYYMTIKGFVQKAYDAAQHECQMTDSLEDEGPHERRSVDSGVDEICAESIGRPASAAALTAIDEGMVSLWMDCVEWMRGELATMGEEAASRLSSGQKSSGRRAGAGIGGASRMSAAMEVVLDRIGQELSYGRRIGKKFRDIVYDSMGGLRDDSEFQLVVCVVKEILSKYLNRYAVQSFVDKYGELYPGVEEAFAERQDRFAPVLSGEIDIF